MERIAWELSERVIRVINIRTIFRETPEQVKIKTSEATKMLVTWKESYFEVRAKIEASGRDARWEFDRKRLFERSDYMAGICEDLHKVAQVKITKIKILVKCSKLVFCFRFSRNFTTYLGLK